MNKLVCFALLIAVVCSQTLVKDSPGARNAYGMASYAQSINPNMCKTDYDDAAVNVNIYNALKDTRINLVDLQVTEGRVGNSNFQPTIYPRLFNTWRFTSDSIFVRGVESRLVHQLNPQYQLWANYNSVNGISEVCIATQLGNTYPIE